MVIPYCRADCLRVTHPFAARLGIATVLARLACIKHATSVRSEPGSNSSYVFKYCPSTLQNSKLTFEPSLKHISRFFKQRTLARRIPSVNRNPDFSLSLFVVVTVVRSEANCRFPRPRFQAPRAKKMQVFLGHGEICSKTPISLSTFFHIGILQPAKSIT